MSVEIRVPTLGESIVDATIASWLKQEGDPVDQGDAVDHGRQYAFRDRKTKKRNFRALWQIRINAAARAAGMTYSRLMEGLKAAKVALDRKILADLAATDIGAFNELVRTAQDALKAKAAKA